MIAAYCGFSAHDALVILTPGIVYDAFDIKKPKKG